MSDSEIIERIKNHGIDAQRLKDCLDQRDNWGKMVSAFEYLTVLGIVCDAMIKEARVSNEPIMYEGEPLTNERAEKIADEILAKFDAMSDEERQSRMRPAGTMKKLTTARHRVLQERKWIEEHGSNLLGYIERYGSANDPAHYGDGGEAIYRADMDALKRAEDYLRGLEAK